MNASCARTHHHIDRLYLPYSVARPALDAVGGDEAAPGAYGDAVVAGADPALGDLHILAAPDVDAVRVRAAPRRGDGEPPHLDAGALKDDDVHLRAVLAAQLAHLQVVAHHQLQRLVYTPRQVFKFQSETVRPGKGNERY